ncbi:uncharacterized protein BX663DRAFT_551976 [Cokeromyces recurvatus]|uniref:uncharacterized protein n=1 Tax=Cokeromyces recurvatus TaxID=90255 RepID=UPI00221EF35F|nr:uncharacterized protein BX663DRAFT_551976 [Cokeromyces recurvatus]KAI7902557.1 hypothetical protein BX663DRAFT_551976 [Cokeromyces recurvatus]
MNDNNSFEKHLFSWALEDNNLHTTTEEKNGMNPTIINNTTAMIEQPQEEVFHLSNSDLFQLYLGEEAQQAMKDDLYRNKSLSEPTPKSFNSNKNPTSSSVIKETHVGSSIGRLDFRLISNNIPESQFKLMTSKERRQLRNKISARNFRHRRKEYIHSLEQELAQQKEDNNQLKLELKWMKTKLEKLQKEYEKLQLDLMLGNMMMNNTVNINSTTTTTLNTSSSDESTLSSSPSLFTDDSWSSILQNDEEFINSHNDTYLSHAVVPNWNMNQILSKETSAMTPTTNSNLLYLYPLLAPALMSIILMHTMTMSTEEILASAKLSSSFTPVIRHNTKLPPYLSSTKEAEAIWDLLQPIISLKKRNPSSHLYLTNNSDATIIKEIPPPPPPPQPSTATATAAATDTNKALTTTEQQDKNHHTSHDDSSKSCSFERLQQKILGYLCEFVATYCTVTDSTQQVTSPHESKFSICRRFKRATSC